MVCDPPYELTSKRPGGRSEATRGAVMGGFMGMKWDGTGVAFDVAMWAECLRVLKPGGHLLAFGGTRTQHRMVCAIEDAGFEIRDQALWAYASGFPKSLDVSKAIDKAAGAEREVVGESATHTTKAMNGGAFNGNADRDPVRVMLTAPATDDARQWEGWGTALKPSYEPVCIARKPEEYSVQWATIARSLMTLWSHLWLMSPASVAEQCLASSPAACDVDPHASAQWSAEALSSTRDALCDRMGTSQFESAMTTCLSTVASWNSTLAESWKRGNTFTTGTASSTTTDARILKCFLLAITPESIILAHKSGQWSSADACTAARYLNATVATLSATLELSVLAPAIDRVLDSYLDAGVSPNLSPITLARKPLAKGMTVAANVLAFGTGAINIDACRVPVEDESYARNFSGDRGHDGTRDGGETGATNMRMGGGTRRLIQARPNEESDANRNAFSKGLAGSVAAGETSLGRWPANLLHDGSPEVVALFPQSAGQQAFVGAKHGERPSINAFGDYGPRPDTPPRGDSGSAARFFWCPKTSAADRNDGTQKGQTWASEDHSHATEVLRRLQRATSDAMTLLQDDTAWSTTSFGNASVDRYRQAIKSIIETTTRPTTPSEISNFSQPWSTSDCIQVATEIAKANGSSLAELVEFTSRSRASSTSASTASVLDAVLAALQMLLRASGSGSKGNFHATVKPTELMRYLCRLVTPPGGTVLDPFMGSGSTLKAAELEGFNAIGIELSEEYAAIARRRIGSDAPLFAQVTE